MEHPRRRHPRCGAGDRRALPVLLHPNYVAVVVEGIALPLVHTGWLTALVFTVLNAVRAAHAHRRGERRTGRPPRSSWLSVAADRSTRRAASC